MRIVRLSFVAVVLFSAFLIGCAATHQPVATPPPPPSDPCPIPTGYKLDDATMQLARSTLLSCPSKLDQVFQALLSIGKHSPSDQNRIMIRDLLMGLADQSKVSELYSKALYRKHFSTKFASLPDIKVVSLPRQMDTVRTALIEELRLKKIAMIECCGDRERYQAAEAEYGRLVLLLECLVLNEEY